MILCNRLKECLSPVLLTVCSLQCLPLFIVFKRWELQTVEDIIAAKSTTRELVVRRGESTVHRGEGIVRRGEGILCRGGGIARRGEGIVRRGEECTKATVGGFVCKCKPVAGHARVSRCPL